MAIVDALILGPWVALATFALQPYLLRFWKEY